jgi:hypothetical protein
VQSLRSTERCASRRRGCCENAEVPGRLGVASDRTRPIGADECEGSETNLAALTVSSGSVVSLTSAEAQQRRGDTTNPTTNVFRDECGTWLHLHPSRRPGPGNREAALKCGL